MMRRLWLFLLPLLFLPSWTYALETSFGTLQLSDFLIGLYLVLVYLSVRRANERKRLLVDRPALLMVIFLWWAFISILLIPLRYDYSTNHELLYSLLKLGKLALYAGAAILTIRAVADNRAWQWFTWSLLAAGIVMGLSLLVFSGNPAQRLLPSQRTDWENTNVVSATMAIIISYHVGLALLRCGSRRWQLATYIGLIVMLLGTILAHGRGGWIAALVAVAYLLYRLQLKRGRSLVLVGLALTVVAYTQFPEFSARIDETFRPDPAYLAEYDAGLAGVDTGARLRYWTVEGAKLVQAPVTGRGFFHRGGLSGLDPVGSHNFFLQMFLETGWGGGVLVLSVFWRMWHQADANVGQNRQVSLPVKAAILAGFVGGLSGEYFYGGQTLLALLLTYAAVGRLPVGGGVVESYRTIQKQAQPMGAGDNTPEPSRLLPESLAEN